MELFDYIKCIFSQKNDFEKLKNYDKTRHMFMTNRFFAIQYPVQASLFNKIGINGLGVAESWRRVGKQYKATPSWIFTKVRKKEKEKKEYSPSEEALEFYFKINEIGMKEYRQALMIDKQRVFEDLELIEKQITGRASTERKRASKRTGGDRSGSL